MKSGEYNLYGWVSFVLSIPAYFMGVSDAKVGTVLVMSLVMFAAADILKALGK